MTVREALWFFWSHPAALFFHRWNWKTALFSALYRAPVFFFAARKAGWGSAVGALTVEFLFRLFTAGVYGAISQTLRCATPLWLSGLILLVILPFGIQAGEWLLHWLRHTPGLKAGIIVSCAMTVLSSVFNWYTMRQGVMLVGAEARPFWQDVQRIPALIAGFLLFLPELLLRAARR